MQRTNSGETREQAERLKELAKLEAARVVAEALTTKNALGASEDNTKIALINNNIGYIQRDITEIKTDIKGLAGNYLTKKEFEDFLSQDYANIKRLVYGAAGVILLAFLGAVASLIIKG